MTIKENRTSIEELILSKIQKLMYCRNYLRLLPYDGIRP